MSRKDEPRTHNDPGTPASEAPGTNPQAIGARPVAADVQGNVIRVERVRYEGIDPHLCEWVQALVDARGHYRTSAQLCQLPGCGGKNTSREFKKLLEKIPALKKYLQAKSGKRGGYKIIFPSRNPDQL